MRVMQVTDTLRAGGMERVAVNLANQLARRSYVSHLCTTRATGPLAALISPRVARLELTRKTLCGVGAVRSLVRYLNAHAVEVVHAHGTALFISVIAGLCRRRGRIVWHNHGGWMTALRRPPAALRVFTRFVEQTIVVSQPLEKWCVGVLGIPANRVHYIPNFVEAVDAGPVNNLPGREGCRIVCVANLLPPKDPINLLQAMQLVAQSHPEAHLLMVGRPGTPEYMSRVKLALSSAHLEGRVTLLGVRDDVPSILQACDIGVLSSSSEGLPLALLEYGLAGLPVVATSVGQCPDVLDGGRLGLVVPSGEPGQLARALLDLLQSRPLRAELGKSFKRHVESNYGVENVMAQVCRVYGPAAQASTSARQFLACRA